MAGIREIVQQYIEEQRQKADLISAKMRRFGWGLQHLTNENYDLWRRYRTHTPMLGTGLWEQIRNDNLHPYQGWKWGRI